MTRHLQSVREAVDGRYGKDANRVLRAIDSAEKDCGIRLLEADPKAGWQENHQISTGMEFVPLEYSVIMVCLYRSMFHWR